MLVLRSQGVSYPKIGKMFNKDHTTIIHWCKQYNVDVGSQLPIFDGRFIRKGTVTSAKKNTYEHLLDEPINRGKLRYADYLKK